MLKAVLGKGNRARKAKEGRQNLTHLKNFLYLIPRSTGVRAGRRGGGGGSGTWDAGWAGPGTVTSRLWCFDPKQVRFPGLQAIRSRVKKCLLLRGAGGGGRVGGGEGCGAGMLNQWKSSERVSRISTGSAEDQEPIHHKVPSMSVRAYSIFVI